MAQQEPAAAGPTTGRTAFGHRKRGNSSAWPDSALRPLSDPGAISRVAPFAWAAIILVLVLLPPSSSDLSMLAVAAGLTTIVIAAALLIPWIQLPPGARPPFL
jgi:hypothetical protein